MSYQPITFFVICTCKAYNMQVLQFIFYFEKNKTYQKATWVGNGLFPLTGCSASLKESTTQNNNLNWRSWRNASN